MARWSELLGVALLAVAQQPAPLVAVAQQPTPPLVAVAQQPAPPLVAVAQQPTPPLAVVAGDAPPLVAVAQQPTPPLAVVAGDAPRAVLLEDGDFFAAPASDNDRVARFPAGSVFEYVGETEDAFGRVWYGVRDPRRLRRRADVYLAPFSLRQFRDFGYRGALLANRIAPSPGTAVAPPAAGIADDGTPWWRPAGVLELGHEAVFEAPVGISARAPDEAEVREAIALLGGLQALARWPDEPIPGELFVPALLPAVFQFDGNSWDLMQPVRLLDSGVSILGNARLVVDAGGPPLAGGLALYCWDLVGVLDPSGASSGSLTAAPPRRGAPAPRDYGPINVALAPPRIRQLLASVPQAMRVPARVDPSEIDPGVLLVDNDGRQAVYLQQPLGAEMTRRLRGKTMALDVVARNNIGGDAATFGIDIEITFDDGRPATNQFTAVTAEERARRYEWVFEVADDAADIIVRLLPLDRSLALEGQGAVVLHRVGLRPAHWHASAPPAVIRLYRVTASSFEGAPLFTRAPVGITTRSEEEARRAWELVRQATWSIADDRLVLAGELRPGMTREQVRAAWGAPAVEREAAGGASVNWVWAEDDRRATFDGDAVMTFAAGAVTTTALPPARCLPGSRR